jgi:hypothetical protein
MVWLFVSPGSLASAQQNRPVFQELRSRRRLDGREC